MNHRIMTLIPGSGEIGKQRNAYGERLPGALRELREWASSPIIGGGFAIDDTEEMGHIASLRHNTWTFELAETGLFGFAAFAFMVASTMVTGWRMVRDKLDKTTVLIGALGFMTGAYFIILGLCTQSFNQVRFGLPLFIVAGVVLRTRALQQAELQRLAEEQTYQAYLEQYGVVPAEYVQGGEIPYGASVYAEWSQSNRF